MKKILTLLGSVGLVVAAPIMAVSCGTNETDSKELTKVITTTELSNLNAGDISKVMDADPGKEDTSSIKTAILNKMNELNETSFTSEEVTFEKISWDGQATISVKGYEGEVTVKFFANEASTVSGLLNSLNEHIADFSQDDENSSSYMDFFTTTFSKGDVDKVLEGTSRDLESRADYVEDTGTETFSDIKDIKSVFMFDGIDNAQDGKWWTDGNAVKDSMKNYSYHKVTFTISSENDELMYIANLVN